MDPQSSNKLIATKYCFLILGDDTSFFFFISLFFVVFVVVVVVILSIFIFTKIIILLLLFYFIYLFYFSCSGMFWDVLECSMFRVLSTPQLPVSCHKNPKYPIFLVNSPRPDVCS